MENKTIATMYEELKLKVRHDFAEVYVRKVFIPTF